MWNCSRHLCAKLSIVVNSVATLYGLGIIVYCLWLLKKWQEETTGMPYSSFIARPSFIHTCLAIGIAICLGTICGYAVANCFSNTILCLYIVCIWFLLFLEIAVIVYVYFMMDWLAKINKYIDENDSEFKSFVLFHLMMIRIVLILFLVPQVSAIAVAKIMRVVGIETMSSYHLDVVDFRQSFLVVPDSSEPDNSETNCAEIEVSNTKINEDLA